MKKRNIITLITDFGEQDGFVGTMKGVILNINPDAQMIDISHKIQRHHINAGAFLLYNSYKYFPQGTIHTIIVDPGVGSDRKSVVVETSDYLFVAPDNKVLNYIFNYEKNYKVFEIQNKKLFLNNVSRTFHGRDIFAPVAAHLSLGLPAEKVGPQIYNFNKSEISTPKIYPDYIETQIIYCDIFGNLITNVEENLLKNKNFNIRFDQFMITQLSTSYSEGTDFKPIAIIGSSNFLEIAVNKDSAKEILKLDVGDKIIIHTHKEQIT